MSTSLPFHHRLMDRGRHLQSLGLVQEAVRFWGRVADMKSLPAALAEEAHSRLGEMQLERGKHSRARRHLAAALAHQPDNPHYHFLLAQAIEEDPKGDVEKALQHYRRALRADGDQPSYLGAFGRLAVELGKDEEGTQALRRAAELAPDDPDVILLVVDGLGAIQPDEAQAILRLSLFRNPRNSRFRKLWSDFQFQRLRAVQEASHSPPCLDEGPTVLPFVPRIAGDGKQARWRRHPAGAPRPHLTLPASDKKHA